MANFIEEIDRKYNKQEKYIWLLYVVVMSIFLGFAALYMMIFINQRENQCLSHNMHYSVSDTHRLGVPVCVDTSGRFYKLDVRD